MNSHSGGNPWSAAAIGTVRWGFPENPADGAEFTYHLARPAQSVRLVVRGADGKIIREIAGATSPGVIHRVTWDLRHVPPPASAGGGGFAGGEEGGGGGGGGGPPEGAAGGRGGGRGGGGGAARADAPVQLPIPTHDIGNRGPYVAPGIFKVTLNVDGDTTTRSFEVRADPTLTVTLAQQKARETFLLDVQAVASSAELLGRTTAPVRSKGASLHPLLFNDRRSPRQRRS